MKDLAYLVLAVITLIPVTASAYSKTLSEQEFNRLIAQKGWDLGLNDPVSKRYGYKTKPFVCEVEYVIDGDTFRCKTPYEKISVRLRAIDAPERGQAQGHISTKGLKDIMPANGTPTHAYIYNHKKDRYGRTVGFVVSAYHRNNTWHLNHVTSHMVNNGYVWVTDFKKESGAGLDYQVLHQDFNKIKNSKKGIWAYPNNVEPSHWRKTNK